MLYYSIRQLLEFNETFMHRIRFVREHILDTLLKHITL